MSATQVKPMSGRGKLKNIYSDETIYSIHEKSNRDIVDVMLTIMDEDGPRPMKNKMPVQKNRNGADRFYTEHHADYEARGQHSHDQMERVLNHNNACPKLYDELNKRRNTGQPKAYYSRTAYKNVVLPSRNFDLNRRCLCLKLKRAPPEERKRRSRISTRGRRSRETKSSSRDLRSRTSKFKNVKKKNRSDSGLKLSKIWLNKGCQCTCYYLPPETKNVATYHDDFMSMQPLEVPSCVVPPSTPVTQIDYDNALRQTISLKQAVMNKIIEQAAKSDIDSGNPETNSVPSVSTYNSFMSMEHEPMVE